MSFATFKNNGARNMKQNSDNKSGDLRRKSFKNCSVFRQQGSNWCHQSERYHKQKNSSFVQCCIVVGFNKKSTRSDCCSWQAHTVACSPPSKKKHISESCPSTCPGFIHGKCSSQHVGLVATSPILHK